KADRGVTSEQVRISGDLWPYHLYPVFQYLQTIFGQNGLRMELDSRERQGSVCQCHDLAVVCGRYTLQRRPVERFEQQRVVAHDSERRRDAFEQRVTAVPDFCRF